MQTLTIRRAKRLSVERRKRGHTQTTLSHVLRCHPSWIAHIEAGRFIPTAKAPTTRRLVRYFGIPLTALLADLEEPS